ncbi:MAG TPA: dienelactone hydrolase family protein [Burkholderiaceae bacterium]|nr:dienelactone hydrolase family protein [Burkholderiaceae bacterium]
MFASQTALRATARAALLACTLALGAVAAQAQSNPYQKGPDPTPSLLENTGPFSVRTTSISRLSASGFGGGTVYYPTASGTYGLIAVSPGFTGTQSTVSFWGERLASHGFVVVVIDTITLYDQPSSRADQLMAALDHVVRMSNSRLSALYGKVDPNRRAVMGHSMGGGGSLIAARENPSLKAAIPMAPWNTSSLFQSVRVPTMIFGCESDSIAPVREHAEPFYQAIPSTTPKAYLEVNNDDHFCVMNGGGHYALLGRYGVAWMKRFVDNDTRYSPYLCGAPHQDKIRSTEVEEYRQNCPY